LPVLHPVEAPENSNRGTCCQTEQTGAGKTKAAETAKRTKNMKNYSKWDGPSYPTLKGEDEVGREFMNKGEVVSFLNVPLYLVCCKRARLRTQHPNFVQ